MTTRQMQAQKLIDHGYQIVPIAKGYKAPMIKAWQDTTFNADAITAGIGVKCGVGDYPICAIDIDVPDEALSAAVTDYCQQQFGMTVERVGRAPKILLVYRASDAGWRKQSTAKYGDHQIEVLGEGQQFVAYAIHPDTNKPYEWVDFLGGLEDMPAQDLPVISSDDIEKLFKFFDHLMLGQGLKPTAHALPASPTHKISDDFTADQPIGLTLEKAKSYLEHLDASDYDLWLKMGMALCHEFDGSPDALSLWDEWSATASNYGGFELCESKWSGFGGNGITARTLVKLGKEAAAQAEIEDKKAIINDYKQRIEKCDDVLVLEKVAKKIGSELDPSDLAILDSVHRSIMRHWGSLIGKQPEKAFVNKLLNVQASYGFEDIKSQSAFTEFGNAERFVKEYGQELMYVSETDTWYMWNKTHWRKSTATEVEFLAKNTINNLLLDCKEMGGVGGNMAEFIQSSLKASMVSNIVRLARVEPIIHMRFSQLDSNNNLLGVGNGTVDLTTGKLHTADPDDCITVTTSVEYLKVDCPVWQQTLLDIFNNDVELIEYVQKLIGYSILAKPVENLFVIMYGDGSNGKSTFLNTIRDVLGQHAKVANSETFLGTAANNGGGPREDILRLMGSRLVTVTEPDEGGILKESLIKAMTGGEALPARAAYGRNTVEVTPTWTTFMPTNHKPIIKGTDHGIWRRLVLLPFTVNFDKHPTIRKDPYRMAKLQVEHAGILAWCVEGALKYQRDGLKAPKVVENARNEYRDDMDLIGEWIRECCVVGQNEIATNRELWASWQAYATANGDFKYISNSRTLAKRLSSRFESAKNIGKEYLRGFKGLSVKNSVNFE